MMSLRRKPTPHFGAKITTLSTTFCLPHFQSSSLHPSVHRIKMTDHRRSLSDATITSLPEDHPARDNVPSLSGGSRSTALYLQNLTENALTRLQLSSLNMDHHYSNGIDDDEINAALDFGLSYLSEDFPMTVNPQNTLIHPEVNFQQDLSSNAAVTNQNFMEGTSIFGPWPILGLQAQDKPLQDEPGQDDTGKDVVMAGTQEPAQEEPAQDEPAQDKPVQNEQDDDMEDNVDTGKENGGDEGMDKRDQEDGGEENAGASAGKKPKPTKAPRKKSAKPKGKGKVTEGDGIGTTKDGAMVGTKGDRNNDEEDTVLHIKQFLGKLPEVKFGYTSETLKQMSALGQLARTKKNKGKGYTDPTTVLQEIAGLETQSAQSEGPSQAARNYIDGDADNSKNVGKPK